MKVQGQPTRTIRAGGDLVEIIDQTALPHAFVMRPLRTLTDVAHAISSMQVRGAPLIGAAAAYGIWLAMRADPSDGALDGARAALLQLTGSETGGVESNPPTLDYGAVVD